MWKKFGKCEIIIVHKEKGAVIMTKTEICRKITRLRGNDRQTLIYSLTDDVGIIERYGVSVSIEENL